MVGSVNLGSREYALPVVFRRSAGGILTSNCRNALTLPLGLSGNAWGTIVELTPRYMSAISGSITARPPALQSGMLPCLKHLACLSYRWIQIVSVFSLDATRLYRRAGVDRDDINEIGGRVRTDACPRASVRRRNLPCARSPQTHASVHPNGFRDPYFNAARCAKRCSNFWVIFSSNPEHTSKVVPRISEKWRTRKKRPKNQQPCVTCLSWVISAFGSFH